jgi:epsilon-lactone hydrolase
MPSLQSQVITLVCQGVIKRRLTEEEAILAHLRNVLNLTRPLRVLVPPKARVTAVDEGGVRGEWVEWKDREADATLLYLHGGGYLACSPQTHRPITLTLARHARLKIFALDYRLAPEHRFPAAVEDALSAYRWLLAQGTDPRRLVVGGDSAGGGLALALMVALRDAGESLPAAAVCLSPWTDLAGTGGSLEANDASCALFHGASIAPAARIYLGDVSPYNPLASPLYADLSGLPPLQIYASSTEVLLDDAVRLAGRARESGVQVDLQVWDGLPHAWPIHYLLMPEARRAIRQIADFLASQCGETGSAQGRAAAQARLAT